MYYYQIALLRSPLSPLTYCSPSSLQLGEVVEVALSKRIDQGVVMEEVEKPSFECSFINLTCYVFYISKVLELSKFIAEYYVCSLGEALSLFIPEPASKTLHVTFQDSTNIVLSEAQQKAFDFLQHHAASLLFGDTGSGKTEIYMKCFEKVLEEGQQALFLLPEIGLTPQMQKRLKAHFGSRVGIWHSKITAKKKAQLLEGLREGEIRIIAGTRSALFLPMPSLGLIVVDEEHDESYKSGSRPRYNAKDLALLFGQKLGCRVVLGSATPTLSSFQKLPFFRLKGTFFASDTQVVYDESDHGISWAMLERICNALENKR